MRLIMIGQPRWAIGRLHTHSCKLRIKTVGQHFVNLSFYFTGNNPSMSQLKVYNFINPRKIAIQHLNIFVPTNRATHEEYIF